MRNRQWIDLRSDTVTKPTEEMWKAMYKAEVGDSMRTDLNPRGEDPTVNRLEEMAAEKLKKEAAMFVPSGTMGNLTSLMAQTQPGEEVIFETESHVYYNELGGFAALGGLATRLVRGRYGFMDPADLAAAIRSPNAYFPRTTVLVLENTHNRQGGAAVSLEEMEAMATVAHKHDLKVHLDGARIFNAAVALAVDASSIAAYSDSVTFCLSKGLSAPVGSVVAGPADFISRARRRRKLLGGDMRQMGVLAAAGIVALETMIDRLSEDHENATALAEGLKELSGLRADRPPIPTNMVFCDLAGLGITAKEFQARMREEGVLCSVQGPLRVRLVTHRMINLEHIKRTLEAARTVLGALEPAIRD